MMRSRSRSPVRSRSEQLTRGTMNKGRQSTQGKVRLYIANVPYTCSWQDLKDLFKESVGASNVGHVILYDGGDGNHSGCGVVEVANSEAAAKACEDLHQHEVNERKIVVRAEREDDKVRHGVSAPSASSESYGGMGGGMGGSMGGGGGYSRMTASDGGYSRMSAGDGYSGMMSESYGGMSGGYGGGMGYDNDLGMGGIEVSDRATSLVAQKIGNMSVLLGPILEELMIDPSSITEQVFVANLDYEKVNIKKVREIFKMAGNIINCEMKLDAEGKSRGLAIVRYQHPVEAVQAISMFNGQKLFDRNMNVKMDRMADSGSVSSQAIPNKMPVGLGDIGMGLGSNGAPLTNISELASTVNTMGSNSADSMGMGGASSMGVERGMGGGMGGMGGMGGGMRGSMGGGMSAGMGGMSAGMGMGMGNRRSGNSVLGGAGLGGLLDNLRGGGNDTMAGEVGMGRVSGGMGGLGGNLRQRNTGSLGGGGLFSQRSNAQQGMYGGGSLFNRGSAGSQSFETNGTFSSRGQGMGSQMFANRRSGGSTNAFAASAATTGGGEGTSRHPNSTVCIKNLPYSLSWQDLKTKCREYGDVRYVEIGQDDEGKPSGVATVRYSTPDDAQNAVQGLHKLSVGGRNLVARVEQ